MKQISIVFTGDYSPVLRTESLALSEKYDLIFNDILEDIQTADIAITSLECTFVDKSIALKKSGPNIKVHKKNIEALKHAGISLVTLANNHIMDFDQIGLESTISACESSGIDYVGVGLNLKEARRIKYKLVEGKKIAFLNFTENEFSTTNGDYPGANPVDPVNNYYDIQEAKSISDFTFVIVHGGIEDFKYPSPVQKKLYRYYIDAGATAVICSHSHCFSGHESYNNGFIFYGLGNFVFDWFVSKTSMINSNWNYGYIVKFLISDSIKFEIIPFIQSSVAPGVFRLKEAQRQAFFNEIEDINKIIQDQESLKLKFDNLCEQREKFYKLAINQFLDIAYRIILLVFPKTSFIRKQKRLQLLNIIRCESHREILINILKNHVK